MSDQPLPINKPVEQLDTLMDFIVKNVVEPSVIAWADAELPVLAAPVIHEVSDFIIDAIIEREANLLKKFLDFKVIDGQVESENKAVKDQLVAWTAAHAGGDPDAIKKAKQDMADAVSKLINFDGT